MSGEKLHMKARTRPCQLALLVVGMLGIAGCGSSSTSQPSHSSSASASTASISSSAAKPASSSLVASASSGSAEVVSASAGGVSATMHGSTHAPKVQQPWPIHFTVTRGGRPVRASVTYEYLLAGQVVARRSHYTFDGHFSDVFIWPAAAVGYPLTFRAVLASEGATINLDYPVQVSR